MKRESLSDLFNFASRGKTLQDYTLTLTRPAADPVAQGEDFRERLTQWLRLQGDDNKGNAEKPLPAAPTAAGNACVVLHCTEETMARIERQFAGEILRADPPPKHVRGAVFPPPVDPWDISKW